MRGSPLDLAALRLASTRGFEWLRLSRGYKRAGEGLAPSIPRRFCDAGTARPSPSAPPWWAAAVTEEITLLRTVRPRVATALRNGRPRSGIPFYRTTAFVTRVGQERSPEHGGAHDRDQVPSEA